jgi:hypothetical protein
VRAGRGGDRRGTDLRERVGAVDVAPPQQRLAAGYARARARGRAGRHVSRRRTEARARARPAVERVHLCTASRPSYVRPAVAPGESPRTRSGGAVPAKIDGARPFARARALARDIPRRRHASRSRRARRESSAEGKGVGLLIERGS